ncbi:thioesterase [Amycolatopsis antarctica]|uniref:Thioesterase n=1 Tax=Amycolatopsis antarctica TaxID=1854586 RepID=A0A263D0L5_9PSEU|nr:alpha/beta fold hydrolase [Amycolatopsis antarctica]OZM71980.1 thioesterase [Amycolatopsis antarctica]
MRRISKLVKVVTTPVRMDRSRATTMVERLSAITHLVASLEYLATERDRRHGGFNNWRIAKRTFHARSPRLAKVFDLAAEPGNTRRLHGARALAAASLQLPLPAKARLAADGVITASTLSLYPRHHYGTDGSDQVSFLCQAVVTISRAGGRNSRIVDACLWFVALQSVLSYAVSGWVKVASSTWRTGEAVTGVMRTLTYGDRTLWTLLRRYPRVAKVLGTGVLALECSFPAVFLGRGRLTPAFVASAASFHLANARFMALGRFFWAFLAMHPAVLYVTGPRQVSGPRRDDVLPAVCGALAAGFLGAGQVARSRTRAVVLAGRPGEERFTAPSGNVLSLRRTEASAGGDAPLLVHCNGLAATAEHWEWIVRGLGDRYDTVTYQRAGYGRSVRHDVDEDTLGTTIDDLVALVRHVAGSRPVVLVGHSLGGYLALRAVERLAGTVTGLALLDSSHPGELNRSDRQRQGSETLTSTLQLMPRSLHLGLGLLLKQPEWVDRMPEQVRELALAQYRDAQLWTAGRREWRATLADFDEFDGTLPSCPVPALVLTAGRTADTDPVQCELHDELAANATESVRHVVSGVDHDQILTDQDAATRVVGLMADFLRGLSDDQEGSRDVDAAS